MSVTFLHLLLYYTDNMQRNQQIRTWEIGDFHRMDSGKQSAAKYHGYLPMRVT